MGGGGPRPRASGLGSGKEGPLVEGASGRLSRSSGGCLRRRNSCAETVPRPEQQQQQPQQPQQQPPPQRCQAITCLIPVGKLAPANFSRLSRHEVSRTSRRLRGARARARSPARFPLPPLPPAALAPGLSPACALAARLSPPAPSARHWAGGATKLRPEPLGRAQCPRGTGAELTQSRSSASARQSRL